MRRFLVHTVLGGLATVLAVTVIAFLLVELLPGDPARIIAGDAATPELVEQVRERLNLDASVSSRYVDFVGGAAHGDLGTSVQVGPGVPVWELVKRTAPATISLTTISLVFAILVSLPLGMLAASKPNGVADRVVTVWSSAFIAIPQFVVALILVIVFSVVHQILPSQGYVPVSDGVWPWFERLIIPCFGLGIVAAAELTRQVRGAFVDTFEQDYIQTARAKGLGSMSVVMKHALKNASVPIVTVIGLQVARLLGGAVIIEQIFNIDGVGRMAFEGVVKRDFPVLQGVLLVTAVVVVIVNMLVDVINGYLVPRSRS